MTQQLALSVNLRDDAIFDHFYAGSNEQLVALLKKMSAGAEEPFVYFWGESSAGKSHLLQACCHLASHYQFSVFYLPLININEFEPAMLADLENLQLICIDDLQSIVGNARWEEAFFHFYNRLRATQTKLIVSASQPPKGLGINIPDLVSRLDWGVTFQVKPLSDAEKMASLNIHAKARGFDIPDKVADFLMKHCRRDMRSLIMVLDMLDQASLVAKRKLTVPFVKNVLGI